MRELKVGVPLFLIYINGLPLVLKHETPSIFADDTLMATSSCKILELQNQLAEDIEGVIQWMANNKLSLNIFKTDLNIVGTPSEIRDLEETLCITVQNECIYRKPLLCYNRLKPRLASVKLLKHSSLEFTSSCACILNHWLLFL